MNRYEFEAKVNRVHDLETKQDQLSPSEVKELADLNKEIGAAPFEFEEGRLRGKTMTFSDDSVNLRGVRTVGDLMAELSRLPAALDIVSIDADGDYHDGIDLSIIKLPDVLSLRIGDS